jgi:hypothetical protein
MWKALKNAHPQFQPQFVPAAKTHAYANLLQMRKDNPPIDCTEQDCGLCRFRQQLPDANMTTVTEHMPLCFVASYSEFIVFFRWASG